MNQRPSLTLRLPPTIHEWITREATANHRTITGEIVARLERTKRADEQIGCPLGGAPAAGQTLQG